MSKKGKMAIDKDFWKNLQCIYSIYMALAERGSGSRLPTLEGIQRPPSPSRERRRSPEKDPKPQIFVASESRRRADFIQAVFGLDDLPASLKPGLELNNQDYGIPIVVKKNDDAIRQLPPGILADRRAKVILIASDVRSSICGVENEVCVTKAKIKVKHIEPVREEVFADMVKASRKTNTNPYYYLDVATEMVTLRGTGEIYRLPIAHTTIIELDPERIAYIATPRGFDRYCREVQSVLASPFHLPNGDPPIANISAFLDLVALLRMNAVAKIGETATAAEIKKTKGTREVSEASRGNPGFAVAAAGALHDAYISYIPTALRALIPDIGQKTANYLPIQQLADYGLQQTA
jgi:hypothetical protein